MMTDEEEKKWLEETQRRFTFIMQQTDDRGVIQEINATLQVLAQIQRVRFELREKALTWAIGNVQNAHEQLRVAQLYYDYLRG